MSSSAFTISLMINQCKLALTMSLMVFGLVFIDSLHKHGMQTFLTVEILFRCQNKDHGVGKVAGTDVLGIGTGFGDNLMI